MRIITKDRVKELLGITDGDHDSDIDLAIPIIDAAVKRITRNRYNTQVIGEMESGSKYVEVYEVLDNWQQIYKRKKWSDYHVRDIGEYLETGQRITGEGVDSDTYIEEVYYNGPTVEFSGKTYNVPVIEMSNAATETNSSAQIFLGVNIGLEPIIAKAVFWQLGQFDTSIRDESWVSKSMGPVSVSKSTLDSRIDGKSGMPLFLIKALPKGHGGH